MINHSPRIFQIQKAAATEQLMSFTSTPVSHSPMTSNQTIKYKKLRRIRKGMSTISSLPAIKHSSGTTTTSTTLICKFSKLKQEEEEVVVVEKKTNNLLLRVAWYSSEVLGIAASFLKSQEQDNKKEKEKEWVDMVISREDVVECIKRDFLNSYFVTGNLTVEAYEEECEFADPAGSFKGLKRFKRNCTNFGLLLLKSNMKLTKWEDFEDKGIGHWKFSCVMSFPWRPILSATGYTEYYFDADTNKVSRHVEHWNVPKMALLRQIFKPTRWHWG